jgi:hypothetical protein
MKIIVRGITILVIILSLTLIIVLINDSRERVPRGVLETGVESIYINYKDYIQSDSVLTTEPNDVYNEMELLLEQLKKLEKDLEKLK